MLPLLNEIHFDYGCWKRTKVWSIWKGPNSPAFELTRVEASGAGIFDHGTRFNVNKVRDESGSSSSGKGTTT